MSTANTFEREMLSLINQERQANGLSPLQLEMRLNDSAEDHSTWMLDTDTFSHTGENGSSAGERMEDAGLELSGDWHSGENIAWQSERGEPGISDDVADLHQSLMDSPGHRANILNPDYDYIGIGIETGEFEGWDAVMVTQNFAATDAVVELDDPTTPAPTAPEPETPVAEGPDPEAPAEDDGTDTPDPDVTDTDMPDTDEPDTDVTEEDVTEEPDTDVVDVEEPDTQEPDSEVPDQEDPEDPVEDVTDAEDPDTQPPGTDVTSDDACEPLTELVSCLDQFEWAAFEGPKMAFDDFVVNVINFWVVQELPDSFFDTPAEEDTVDVAADGVDPMNDTLMPQSELDGCFFGFA